MRNLETEKTEGDIKTMWTKELFGTEKPIIALLHLDPLPGDPDFCGSLDTVIEHASCDVKALQEGGVDGVLIANEFSFPMTYVSHTETLMAMACVIGAIKKDIHVPFGTNVVMNPEETIRMAKAVGASFGRSAFAGARVMVDRVKPLAVCGVCGESFSPVSLYASCPKCGSYKTRLVSGQEFRLTSLIVETDK